MIDPLVHAALIVVFAWLLKLLANLLGFDLSQDAYNEIAGLVVAYILSLFGYALYIKATVRTSLANGRWYKPPFTSGI